MAAPLRLAVIAAALVLLAFAAVADEIETHHAHEHGIASLNIGIEADRIELEFDSPAVNVIGFEHAPRTDTERHAAARAERALRNAKQLFALTDTAECRATSADLVAPTWTNDETHADYEARYAFQCAKPQLLRIIDVRLVNELAEGTRLRVQSIVDGKQTGTEIMRGRSSVTIRWHAQQ